MSSSPYLRTVDSAQAGDIMLFTGHVGFYDPDQSPDGDFLSATTTKGIAYSKPEYFGKPKGSFSYMRLQVCR